jgi:hypothetical protein
MHRSCEPFELNTRGTITSEILQFFIICHYIFYTSGKTGGFSEMGWIMEKLLTNFSESDNGIKYRSDRQGKNWVHLTFRLPHKEKIRKCLPHYISVDSTSAEIRGLWIPALL